MAYKNRKSQSKAVSKKLWLPFVCLAAVVMVAGAVFWLSRTHGSNTAANGQESDINFSPPTEEEKTAGDEIKPQLGQNETHTNPPSEGKKAVTPTITYADLYGDQVEVGAFVNGIFEDGGTCTLTLAKAGVNKTAVVQAVKGANSVDCPVMIVKRSELSPGPWQAKVSYNSNNATGKSAQKAVEVK